MPGMFHTLGIYTGLYVIFSLVAVHEVGLCRKPQGFPRNLDALLEALGPLTHQTQVARDCLD